MNLTLTLKRPFIWIGRFRKRCGYGVHSPFAFDLITNVIYEKTSYYAYRQLAMQRKRMNENNQMMKRDSLEKVDRLLFRLVNRMQPTTIVEMGPDSVSSLYLKAGKITAKYLRASTPKELDGTIPSTVDFLYFNDYQNPQWLEPFFDICANHAQTNSLFVVNGICYSKEMKHLWKLLQTDERVGITFDLYDVGLIFFDLTKIKQHYVVNF